MSKYRPAIRVKDPCSEPWEEMTGNDQVRFCSHCAKHVNDLSKMSKKDAIRLVKSSEGNLCVRYIEHPKTREPLFADNLYQITRRAPRLAAGVVGATLSLASLSYAQGSPVPIRTAIERTDTEEEKPDEITKGTSRIFGTVFDTENAVIPGVKITVKRARSREERTAVSAADGSFDIGGLEAGTYVLTAEGPPGFDDKTLADIGLTEGGEHFQNIQMEVAELVVVAGGIGFTDRVDLESELAKAVYSEILDDVLDLLAAGADPNEAEENGNTPLFISVEDNTLDIARALLTFGANANALNEDDQNPLFSIDDYTPVELVELLLAHGADVKQKAKDGKTPLIHAAEYASPKVLKVLIDAGADVNAADKDGWTPLMRAAWEDSVEKVRMLLLAGAEVNARNKKGETAWDQATDEEVEALLVSFGAIVDDDEEDDDEPDN